MNGTEVRIGSGFGEGIRKLIIRVQSFGFEGGFVLADHGVGNIVAIDPMNRGARGNRDGCRCKREIVDLDLRSGITFLLSGSVCMQPPLPKCTRRLLLHSMRVPRKTYATTS